MGLPVTDQRILELLACPVCAGPLAAAGGALRCPDRHTFDIARRGYVDLLPGGIRGLRPDTAQMVRARVRFLTSGRYAPLVDAVARAAESAGPVRVVVDAGAGPGHHLAAVLDRLPAAVGLALDLSRDAARHAARVHERAAAAVADVRRRWPVRDGAVDLVLDVFAPRNGPQIERVLAPEGALLVVTPRPEHLAELVAPLGLLEVDRDKAARVTRSLGSELRLVERTEHHIRLRLAPSEVTDLVGMGPSAWHLEAETVRGRAEALGPTVDVTAAWTVSCYRRHR